MNITQNELADLVTEELYLMVERGELDEGFLDRLRAKASGVGTKIKGRAQAAKQRAQARKTGLKAKAVSKLGGDASKLQTQAGEEAELAAKTKTDSQQAAKLAQAKSILGRKVNQISRLNTSMSADVQKLGLGDLLGDQLQSLEDFLINLQKNLEQLGMSDTQKFEDNF